jgi:hypothetical protein
MNFKQLSVYYYFLNQAPKIYHIDKSTSTETVHTASTTSIHLVDRQPSTMCGRSLTTTLVSFRESEGVSTHSRQPSFHIDQYR